MFDCIRNRSLPFAPQETRCEVLSRQPKRNWQTRTSDVRLLPAKTRVHTCGSKTRRIFGKSTPDPDRRWNARLLWHGPLVRERTVPVAQLWAPTRPFERVQSTPPGIPSARYNVVRLQLEPQFAPAMLLDDLVRHTRT